jgi:hypothetical protein
MNSYETFRQRAAERAARRYGRCVEAGVTPRRADGDAGSQVEHFRLATERSARRKTQLRLVLAGHGILSGHYMPYCNFGLHVDRLIREHEGRTLRQLVEIAVSRWTSRGLRPEVLKAICGQVFQLEVD